MPTKDPTQYFQPTQLYKLYKVPAHLGFKNSIYERWLKDGWVHTYHQDPKTKAKYITGQHAIELYHKELIYRKTKRTNRPQKQAFVDSLHPERLYRTSLIGQSLGFKNTIIKTWQDRGWLKIAKTEYINTLTPIRWITGAHVKELYQKEIQYRLQNN